jgi:hypothetical protein
MSAFGHIAAVGECVVCPELAKANFAPFRTDSGLRSARFVQAACGELLVFPLPGQEFVHAFGRLVGQSREHVDERSLWPDLVELRGRNQGVDHRGRRFVGAGECPVFAADRNRTNFPPGSVVGHAQPAIIEKAGEPGSALEAVVDRPGGLAVGLTVPNSIIVSADEVIE